MTERKGRRPESNDVQVVISTIDGYRMGPIRALGQDPPQNSSDARASKSSKCKVEYVLHNRKHPDGKDVTLLTITDSRTIGLDGPILTTVELEERRRAEGELVIREGENWAAWEAAYYTKEGPNNLGNRGLGKFAYLIHSAHPWPNSEDDPDGEPKNNWRMIILYDTLLPSGEYRLGVRYHNPASETVYPPYEAQEAHDVLRDGYRENGFDIPLGLEPLREVGTRIIIPFLSCSAREAINTKELHRWLRLEWWRQIQKGQMSITVDSGDGLVEEIGIPPHWIDEPWKSDSEHYFVREKKDDPDACGLIKRFVVHHDESLDEQDYPGDPQEVGIQMLRGGQWIQTLGCNADFNEQIPADHRPGIRGFVEFDESVEAKLRDIESPAHDGFNKRKEPYREIVQTAKGLMKEFARERGWAEEEDDEQDSSYDDLLREIVDFFLEPDGPPVHPEWSSRVSVSCEGPDNRASWGESVGVTAECRRTPTRDGLAVQFNAVLIRPDGSEIEIFGPRGQNLASRPDVEYSRAGCDFGQLDVMNPGGDPLRRFFGPGRYAIEVRCVVDGEEVTRSRSVFYVEAEPPPPPPRTLTMEIQAHNGGVRSDRFEDGDELSVVATLRNYGPDGHDGDLNIAVTDLADGVLLRESARIAGVPPGTPPEKVSRVTDERIVREAASDESEALVLPKGHYEIRASFERFGEVLAVARTFVFVGPDEDEDDDGLGLPFDLIAKNNRDAPRWTYTPRYDTPKDLVEWSDGNPVYKTLTKSAATEDVRDVNLEALIERAVRKYEDGGDEGGLRIVTYRVQNAVPDLVNKMGDAIDRLLGALGDSTDSRDVLEYGNSQRKLAVLMAIAMRENQD